MFFISCVLNAVFCGGFTVNKSIVMIQFFGIDSIDFCVNILKIYSNLFSGKADVIIIKYFNVI